jgi:glycosyltransferase involved in cell wall biosynthesis
MKISIIIPVRNGGAIFNRCLRAIANSRAQPFEVIVADDGSTDDTAQVAAASGARVFATPKPGSGPAVGRNLAAQQAHGDLLFFFDSDVEIKPDTLSRLAQIFENDPTLAALFGSYDDSPSDPSFISQYKNLFHHYVHQQGAEEASTFWSGCGAIRRDIFLGCGGFSSRYALPSIEDIELGYTLKSRGHRIRLEKTLQVKHLKRWTLYSLLHSDILARGIPWTRLLLRSREFLNDLNLQTHNRLSVAVTYLMVLCFALSVLQPLALLGLPFAALALLMMNCHLYEFFYRKRGFAFMLGGIAMHWFYYFYNGISFGLGMMLHLLDTPSLELWVSIQERGKGVR